VVCHHSLLLMNSFKKTEAAVFSCRLCFLRAFPLISLICSCFHFKSLWWVTTFYFAPKILHIVRSVYTCTYLLPITIKGGGHLVHINNAHEQTFVQNFMLRHNQHQKVWIGFYDKDREGHYKWTDGSILTDFYHFPCIYMQ